MRYLYFLSVCPVYTDSITNRNIGNPPEIRWTAHQATYQALNNNGDKAAKRGTLGSPRSTRMHRRMGNETVAI